MFGHQVLPRMLNMPGESRRQLFTTRRAITALSGFALGVAIYWRDWALVGSDQPFYTSNYYQYYSYTFMVAFAVALVIILAFDVSALDLCIPLLLPSFVLRHTLFLLQLGPTNTWPPVAFVDFALLASLVLTGLGATLLRNAVLKRLRRS
jgi:hypothetical protein